MPRESPKKRRRGRASTLKSSTDLQSRRRLLKAHLPTESKRREADATAQISPLDTPGSPWILVPARTDISPASPSTLDYSPSPVSPLGAGRVDPFANYPVIMDADEHLELVDHFMFTAPSVALKPQKRVCFLPLFQEVRRTAFELAQNDEAAFSVILAIAAADKSILYDDSNHLPAIEHSTKSLQLLRTRIASPSEAAKEGTIATVALQIVYQLLFEGCDSLDQHLDALEHLVRLRGGIDEIEKSNPKLALLINLADYLPPTTALVGRRRFHQSLSNSENVRILSPVALAPPKGLEALAQFDTYVDLKQICLVMHNATLSVSAGQLFAFSTIEYKIQSQLRDLVALGTSNTAWGRRCEILKCVHLSALMYLRVIFQPKLDNRQVQMLPNLISTCFPWLDPPLEVYIQRLLPLFQTTDEPDEKSISECLGPLMSFGARIDGPSWKIFRESLQAAYEGTFRKPVSNPRTGLDPQEVDSSGLAALFGFFNLRDE